MATSRPVLEPSKRRITELRVAVVALAVLATCEVVILHLYVGAMQRSTEVAVELEYARGAAAIAYAQAQRCSSLAERK